jgi:8-oxo-dGTP pyrophosphatase MutT (NUDIX family)
MREPGEAPRQAAVRELDEETGIAPAELDFALVAEFSLQRPSRHEYAAVYRTSLGRAPVLLVNDEASAFQWWEPCSSIGEHMSPLDTDRQARLQPVVPVLDLAGPGVQVPAGC